jgi:D-alanyl-D-alanine carboxypeptidase (penicillin-binding protein 5/6)
MMNKTAADLGMTNSHFMNPTGLPNPEHYSSAHDMATWPARSSRRPGSLRDLLAERVLLEQHQAAQPQPAAVARQDRRRPENRPHRRSRLLHGASAVRDGQRLIAVVFGTNSEQARAAETQKLLTYGFRFFETQTFYQKGTELTQAPVWKGATSQVKAGLAEDLTMTMPKGQLKRLQASMTMNPQLTAPIAKGDVIGKVEVKLDDKVVHSADLIALDGVEEGGIFRRMWDSIRLFFYGLFN